MKKNNKHTALSGKQSAAGYAAQNFEQGRGGYQSGHDNNKENFNQFQNKGNAGYASEHSINGSENNHSLKKS